jgi:hypothetical protein
MTVKPDPPPQAEVGLDGSGEVAASTLFQSFLTQRLPAGVNRPNGGYLDATALEEVDEIAWITSKDVGQISVRKAFSSNRLHRSQNIRDVRSSDA